jgi:predicted Zn-dependent protease with MMP-like domain
MDRDEAPPDLSAAEDAVDFDEVIDDVIDDLPEAFAERLGSVAIVVEDEASPDQLASVGAGGLFGLYQGVPRTRFGVDNVPLPSKITLFRGPLTRFHPTPERLTTAIEDTLLHEIAHHFGIDDNRLHELLAEGRAGRISRAASGTSGPRPSTGAADHAGGRAGGRAGDRAGDHDAGRADGHGGQDGHVHG